MKLLDLVGKDFEILHIFNQIHIETFIVICDRTSFIFIFCNYLMDRWR